MMRAITWIYLNQPEAQQHTMGLTDVQPHAVVHVPLFGKRRAPMQMWANAAGGGEFGLDMRASTGMAESLQVPIRPH